MSAIPFDSLINLVQFDQQLKKVAGQTDKEQKELNDLQKQKQAIMQELELLRQAIHDAQKEVDAKELDMKTLDQREKDLKQKLDMVSKAREYTPLKNELEVVQKEQLALEDALVYVWNQLETAQRTMVQKKDAIESKIKEMEQVIDQKKQSIEQLHQQLESDKARRKAKEGQIPVEWLEKYNVMRERVDNPVVEVTHGICGGCFYTIPDQELLQLKRRALLQCKSCYRFLYDPTVLQQEQKAEE